MKSREERKPCVPQAIMSLPVRFLPCPHFHASVRGQPVGRGCYPSWTIEERGLGDIHDVAWECGFVPPRGRLRVSSSSACPERLSCLRCTSQAWRLHSSLTWVESLGVLLIAVSHTPHLDNQRMLSLPPALVLDLPTATVVSAASPLT